MGQAIHWYQYMIEHPDRLSQGSGRVYTESVWSVNSVSTIQFDSILTACDNPYPKMGTDSVCSSSPRDEGSLTDGKLRRVRKRVKRACDECRVHKARCDGKLSCETCTRYDRSSCLAEQLIESSADEE